MAASYAVKPVLKAVKVLECLGEAKRDLTLGEVGARTGLPKATAYRYLCTLRDCGLVSLNSEAALYSLGPRMFELGQMVSEHLHLRTAARPLLMALRDRCQETVNLGTLDGLDVIYVEVIESAYTLRMQARVGGRDRAYATALGKAILAFMPAKYWPGHLPAKLIPLTVNTITNLSAFRRDLTLTRERGYSLDNGENEDGATCVGVPILGRFDQVLAAISVSGPNTRVNRLLNDGIADEVMQTANAISQSLGDVVRPSEGRRS